MKYVVDKTTVAVLVVWICLSFHFYEDSEQEVWGIIGAIVMALVILMGVVVIVGVWFPSRERLTYKGGYRINPYWRSDDDSAREAVTIVILMIIFFACAVSIF